MGGIFCDLQKAFDCVNHDILLEKMKHYGITDVAYKLWKSYLSNGYQRTVIKANNSNYFSLGKLLNMGFHKDQYWDLFFFLFILTL